MEFGAVGFLYLLLLVPLLIGSYILLLKRKRSVLRYSNVALVKEVVDKTSWFKRHGPSLFLLIAVILAVVSLSKPQAEITMPYDRKTYIIAMDTSGSMMAEDMKPTRLSVMKQAVIQFIRDNTAYKAQIGLVSYDYTSYTLARPTSDGEMLERYVTHLISNGGTAMGEGIIESLNLIYPKGSIIPDEELTPENIDKVTTHYKPGENDLAVIILLSDGDSSMGIEPIPVARAAAKLGIRVYTIGLGTKDTKLDLTGGSGIMTNVELNETLLKDIATITHGEYHKAEDANSLKQIYGDIATKFLLETRDVDITYLFAAAAAFFMIIAFVLATLWMSVKI